VHCCRHANRRSILILNILGVFLDARRFVQYVWFWFQIKDSIIGANCTVSEKTSLSNVALSGGCTVGEKARISNSVIMDGVKIEPGVVIQVVPVLIISVIRIPVWYKKIF
jgi:carbonic anhydrase/acetyltransferase-like protein (isoleucine patch superfamily)